jgi:2,4-dienoyl-CoA reductase (NADPH2)
MSQLAHLFEPVRLGTLEVPNRIVMAALTTNFDHQQEKHFLVERARGGVGLITTGALQTLYPGRRADLEHVHAHNDADIPILRDWVSAIHAAGDSKVAAQLATYEYWARGGHSSTAEDVAPSAVELPLEKAHPYFARAEFRPRARVLTLEEIHDIEEAIGHAARRIQEAEFDAIELQIVAGNLLHRFLSASTNQRDDEYGGSFENRCRIVVRSLEQMRAHVGPEFPILARVAVADLVPWGMSEDEWLDVVRVLEANGVAAFGIYPGWHETRVPRHQMSVPRGAFVHLAATLKTVTTLPVIANIRINDVRLADRIIAEGKADLIAMGSPLLADAYLPIKAKDGRPEDIRMCTACCTCWNNLKGAETVTCSINAQLGHEEDLAIVPTDNPRKVYVVGGGPAGLETARVAATRGHDVTLVERRDRIGGQLLEAVRPPFKGEWETLVDWYGVQLEKLGVHVRLNEECTVESVKGADADVVVVATGANPAIPPIAGVTGPNVWTSTDVLQTDDVPGTRVLVVGGGATGCEVAEYMEAIGKRVTLIEMSNQIARDVRVWNRWVVIDRLAASSIRIELETQVTAITPNGVQVLRRGLFPEFFEADLVVLAVGVRPENALVEELATSGKVVRAVGDCAAIGQVDQAVAAGFRLGREI